MNAARSLTAALLAALLGQAVPSVPSGAEAPSPSPESTSALSQLAGRLARQVLDASPEGAIGLYARADSAELARSFVTLLVSEVSKAKLAAIAVSAASPESAEDVARERGARSLARVYLSLEGGQLVGRGDLIGTWVNFWSGNSPPRPPHPAAVLQAAVTADAQILALASSSAGGVSRPKNELNLLGATLAALPLPPAAIAAGDLNGDGKDEIVALTNEELIVFSAEGRVLARYDHRSLPASPTPCREPFGAVAIYEGSRRIAYLSANRARGQLLEIDPTLSSLRAIERLDRISYFNTKPSDLGATFTPGQNTISPDGFFHNPRDPYIDRPFSAVSFSRGEGLPLDARRAFAPEPPPQGVYVFPDGTGAWFHQFSSSSKEMYWKLSGLGAATALVDVDGDGWPKLVTTSSLYAPDPDELRVLQGASPRLQQFARGPLRQGGTAQAEAVEPPLLWSGSIARGRALQMTGARIGSGKQEQIVLGVWRPDGTGELQVFRKAPR